MHEIITKLNIKKTNQEVCQGFRASDWSFLYLKTPLSLICGRV